jgi:hypothetical protein
MEHGAPKLRKGIGNKLGKNATNTNTGVEHRNIMKSNLYML